MPFSQVWHRNGLQARFSGILTKEDLMLQKAELFMAHRAMAVRYIIIDLLGVEGFDLSVADIRDFARLSGDMFRPYEGTITIKLPIIASRDDLLALAQEYVRSHKGRVLVPKIFRSEPEAMAWAKA